jgi:hypothetical protein
MVSSPKALSKAVAQGDDHFVLVFLLEGSAEGVEAVSDVVVKPGLCIMEVNDEFSQMMDDPLGIVLVQFLFKSLGRVDIPFFEEFSDLGKFLFCLTLHASEPN